MCDGSLGAMTTTVRGWAHALAEIADALPPPDQVAEEDAIAELCTREMERLRTDEGTSSGASTSASASLPALFTPKAEAGSLADLFSRDARMRALRLRNELLLDSEEVESLWFLLKEHSVVVAGEVPPPGPDGTQAPPAPDQEVLDYDAYCEVAARAAELWGAKCSALLAPSTFLKFPADGFGRVSSLAIFSYAMRSVSATQTRIHLTFHADDARYISAAQLRDYLDTLASAIPALSGMEETFRSTWLDIAMAKLLFLHDAHLRGRVRIAELVASPALNEFFELRGGDGGEAPPQEALGRNWFSMQSTQRLQQKFMDLDRDMNGTLAVRELLQYGGGNLTQVFVKRIFEVHVSKRRAQQGRYSTAEMEFPAFVEFELAMSHKKHPNAAAYFFRVLDVGSKGYLTREDLHTFFREVLVKWTEAGNYDINADDVEDEVVDIIAPRDTHRITLGDLMRCGNSDVVINILSDVAGFWAYDSRESLMHQDNEDASA